METKERYSYSTDGEHYYDEFDSRESALAEAVATYGDEYKTIWTGKCVTPDRTPDADALIEQVALHATEETGDWSEGYLEHIPREAIEDLQQQLQSLWDAWEEKHGLAPTWYNIEFTEEHRIEREEAE